MLLPLLFLLPRAGFAQGPGEWITHLMRIPLPERLDLCGEPVPLDREDVAERLDLELVVTLGSPVRTALWFKRIPREFPLVERELRSRGLPEDLKYVTLVESNLRADAVSPAGAAGPWQFIRSTGSRYGLKRDGERDMRRDWVEATRAALDYLEDLHEAFGSWALALAAYNTGERRVARALEDQGESEYYGLKLPRETERYVFRVMAAKLVVEDPAAYGIDLEGARRYGPRDLAEVPVEVDRSRLPAAALAEAAGVSYRRFLELNPWVVGSGLPKGTHRIRVPSARAQAFPVALARWEAEHPEPKTVYYTVRPGDTLWTIARRHRVGLRQLCSWNDLSPRSVIRPGQELVVLTVD
ncbi:MAG: hypothetical protein Kow0092_16190 [Deferrisomatales bacterium]